MVAGFPYGCGLLLREHETRQCLVELAYLVVHRRAANARDRSELDRERERAFDVALGTRPREPEVSACALFVEERSKPGRCFFEALGAERERDRHRQRPGTADSVDPPDDDPLGNVVSVHIPDRFDARALSPRARVRDDRVDEALLTDPEHRVAPPLVHWVLAEQEHLLGPVSPFPHGVIDQPDRLRVLVGRNVDRERDTARRDNPHRGAAPLRVPEGESDDRRAVVATDEHEPTAREALDHRVRLLPGLDSDREHRQSGIGRSPRSATAGGQRDHESEGARRHGSAPRVVCPHREPVIQRNVKGILFADYVRMIRFHKDADWASRLEPEDLRYLGECIVDDAWYPMGTFERLGNAILAEIAAGDVQAARVWGSMSVDRLRAAQPSLLSPGDPVETLMRFRVLRATYFDFDAIEVTGLTDGHASIVIHYYMGRRAEEAASHQTMGFFERLLQLAGARDLDARFVERSWAGDPRTLLTVDWSL